MQKNIDRLLNTTKAITEFSKSEALSTREVLKGSAFIVVCGEPGEGLETVSELLSTITTPNYKYVREYSARTRSAPMASLMFGEEGPQQAFSVLRKAFGDACEGESQTELRQIFLEQPENCIPYKLQADFGKKLAEGVNMKNNVIGAVIIATASPTIFDSILAHCDEKPTVLLTGYSSLDEWRARQAEPISYDDFLKRDKEIRKLKKAWIAFNKE